MIKVWLKEMRANFLVLSVLLVMIGGAAAWKERRFNLVLFILTVIGVTVAHVSVNLFNEYSDWRTGIDTRTKRTPFSGGSGNLQTGALDPAHVRIASWISLMIAFFIGLYLAWASGWPILVIMGIGGFVAVIYTDHLAKWMLGEFASGLTLGSFVVIGAYFVQTVQFTSGIIYASVPSGLLTMGLLYLNEFPDYEADKFGGRKHLVIFLGKKRAAVGYAVILVGVYASIILSVLSGTTPATVLIGLLTLPLAVITGYKTLMYPENDEKLLPALGINVILVLSTDLLLAVGFIIG